MSRSTVWLLSAAGAVLIALLIFRSIRWSEPSRPGDLPHNAPRVRAADGDAFRDEAAGLLKAGRFAEARTCVERWAREVPGDERAVLARAELAARLGRTTEAIELYTSVADEAADPAHVWLRIADLQESLGRTETAVESCRRALAVRPDDDEARLRTGDLLRITGRLEEAADILEPLAKRTPGSLAARHALAAVRSGQGRFEDVIALLSPHLGSEELPPNARQHYAVALDELGRYIEAADVWAGLLEVDPYLVEGYYRLGRLARRLKEPRRSRSLLERYEQLTPYRKKLESARKLELSGRRVAAAIERAEAYVHTDQIGLAVEQLRRAVHSGDVDVDGGIAAILSLVRLGLFQEALDSIAHLRSTSALPGYVADAMAGLANERSGQTPAAIDAYERALAARPDYRTVLLALGRIRLDSNQTARASALVRRAHELQTDAESTLLLGRIEEADGDHELAGQRFLAAVQLASRPGPRAEARAGLGRARLALPDLEGARRVFEEATRDAPTLAEAWSGLAEACRGLGDTQRAAEADQQATELKHIESEVLAIRKRLREDPPSRAQDYVRLAELALRNGDRARHVRYLWTSIHVDPSNGAAYRSLVDAYAASGETFLELHALRRLAEVEPQDPDLRKRLQELRASLWPKGQRE